MALQLNGKTALYAFIVLLVLANIFSWMKDIIGFGQGQLDRDLNQVKAAAWDREARLRSVEGDIREIKTLQSEMAQDIKEIKEEVKR
jgi:hypothetical protein